MIIHYSTVCDIGKKRIKNQDAILARTGEDWGVFAIADGMGGHSEGERASHEIIAALEEWLGKYSELLSFSDAGTVMTEARKVMNKANLRILENTDSGEICGSTVVLLIVLKDVYVILSVGDSRCYAITDHLFRVSLTQLTYDEIRRNTDENSDKLTNAVGIRQPLKCSVFSAVLDPPQEFLLCSDGVYKYCPEKVLVTVIKENRNKIPELIGDKIRERVYEYGAGDNLSAIYVRINDDGGGNTAL